MKDALAILYNSSTPDSLLLKKAPDYFTRTGENGKFQILNIRSGSYRVFALSEKNNNYVFDQPDESVGLITEVLELKDSADFQLKLYKQHSAVQAVKSNTWQEPGKLITVFANPVTDLTWEFVGADFDKVVTGYNIFKDTVELYCLPPSDSVQIIWKEKGEVIDTANYRRMASISGARATLKKHTGHLFTPATGSILTPETNPTVKWWAPVLNIDSSKISVLKDSTAFVFTTSFSDSINTTLVFHGDWKEGVYTVKILPAAITDMYGFSNDSVITTFSVSAERSKGSISFIADALQPGKYLLQLVNDKDELIRQREFENSINSIFEWVDPGSYRFRMISDTNGNGRWDNGDFRSRLQPEEVRYYGEPVIVRANWEVEIEWRKLP
jgi:uncharacterized protein (DUF2141 family)